MIIFSVKRAGDSEPTYSDRLDLQSAKKILSDLKIQLNNLNEKDNFNKDSLLNEVELYFFDVQNKEELKERVAENKSKLKPLIIQYLKEEKSIDSLNENIRLTSNTIERKASNIPEIDELKEINREIDSLCRKRDKLKSKIQQKRSEIAKQYQISSLKEDSTKRTCELSEINKKIKHISQISGISRDNLEHMINTERNRLNKN